MKKTLLILTAAATVVAVAIPAFAQDAATAPEPTLHERVWPPAWVDMSLDELEAVVEQKATDGIDRIEKARRLTDAQKASAVAALNDLLDAVHQADSNPEVVGLAISRVQLERIAVRAERRGESPDFESNISGDIDRADRRLDRLAKVTAWAGAAGEDVTEVNAALASARAELAVATGDGTVQQRHDAVHIALAWTIEAAAVLDGM